MKKIDISTPKHPNTFALVDDSDFEELNKYKWHAHEYRSGKAYAARRIQVKAKSTILRMHTAIIGKVKSKEADHIDGDGLNNQRYNLRHCTHAENGRNRGIPVNNTSGYKGVSWNKQYKKWQVHITQNGKRIYLGMFFCLVKAAKRYDQSAKKYHGEFAGLNFKEEI